MSNLIDSTFFIRDITIPNIDPTPNPKNAPMLERLNSFITKYEKDCLVKILGAELAIKIYTEDTARIGHIKTGTTYVDYYDQTQVWQGLIHDTNISLIANYVYYYFQEASASQTTGVSTSVSSTEAGHSISPMEKMINAWNFFSTEVNDLINFLWITEDMDGRIYPEFTFSQFFAAKRLTRPNNIFGI